MDCGLKQAVLSPTLIQQLVAKGGGRGDYKPQILCPGKVGKALAA